MMRQIVVREFGGPETLELVEVPTPEPGPGEALVRMTTIGMNHADLMMRAGEYRLSSGDPPFTPGIEGGGIVEAVGPGADGTWVGRRVILGVGTRPISGPRPFRPGAALGGTYRSHYLCPLEMLVAAPDGVPDDHLGCLWLAYLTAWGCLRWKQQIKDGQFVLITAASSPVAWAAAQIARQSGAIPVGLTTSPIKAEAIAKLHANPYAAIFASKDHEGNPRAWTNEVRRLSGPDGVRCAFDPIAAGAHIDQLIKVLGQHGTIWIYGLLGEPGPVNLFPLIRKYGSIRGWLLNELAEEGPLQQAVEETVAKVASGEWRLPIAGKYCLEQVRQAHEDMAMGRHFGKLLLIPG